MASREASPVGGSDVSSGDDVANDALHSSQRPKRETSADSSNLQSLDEHSDNDALHPHRSRPYAGFSTSFTNDSFGQPLGNSTTFASTRPFNSYQAPTDVEQFLSGPPVANQTFTPSSFHRGTDTLHVSANSSFVSIPKTESNSVDVSASTSPHHTNAVPSIVAQPQGQASSSSFTAHPLTATTHQDPKSNAAFYASATSSLVAPSRRSAVAHGDSGGILTATQSSPLVSSSKPPIPTVTKSASNPGTAAPLPTKPASLTVKAPSMLVATTSSSSASGNTGTAGLVAPRSPQRRNSNGTFPPTSPVGGSPVGPATMPAAAGSARPGSPSMHLARTTSSHSLNSHFSDLTSPSPMLNGGAAAQAGYSPMQRNGASPNFGTQTSLNHHRYPSVLASSSSVVSPTQREPGMAHSRSESGSRHLFGDRGNATTLSTAAAPQPYSFDSLAGTGRRSPSRSSGPALSVGSRQRGVVRATESSPGTTGTHTSSRYTPSGSSGGSSSAIQPLWLSAVERMKSNRGNDDLALYDPVLPYDQSKLGMQTRQAGQQGTLTAGKLRALEAQHASAFKSNDRSGLQPLVAYSVAGGRPNSPTPRLGTPSPTRMPTLTAQEEAIQTTARYGRALSEQSGSRRTGHIRSTANGGGVSAYGGGRHAVTAMPSTLRGATGSNSGVITASETVTNGSNFGSATGTFTSRSEQGGLPGFLHGSLNSKIGTAEHRLANLFQMRSASNAAGLHAKETSGGGVGTASLGSGNGGGSSKGVLRASEEQKAVTPRTSGGSAGAGGGGGGGGGGGSSNNNNSSGNNGRKMHSKRGDMGNPAPTQSKELKKQMDAEGDEDERDERNFRTRNINALHAIPWDQRRQLPMTGFGTRFFALLSTPRFWEKLDWAVRGSLLTVLPTMVLALEPATTNQFPMASSLAFNAFWITMPTFGSGLRELIIALKGFSFGLIFLIIVVAIQPGPDWLLLLLLFVFTLFSSFVAEETKKTTAYVLASTIMQYLTDHTGTNFHYVGQYYEGLLIALAFGTAAFLVPFIRWSSDIGRHYIKAMSNSLSIGLQGTLSSFWVRAPLERELNVMRLRQLRATAEKCIGKIETALDESGYEPHTGAYMACMTNRFNFCKSIHNILGSLNHVVELIADNPSSVDTPMCNAFGEQIGDDLAIISSAMDSMVLKICDFERIVTPQEIQFFREARERFQEAVSRVREDVVLTNENYETDESDILLGFFMFSVDEMCEVISQFEETANPPSTFRNALLFPVRDVKSVISAFKNLALTVVRRRTIPRRLKEAIKLAVCMVLPCIFQVYALGNDSVSPMAGASVIALIYNPTGSESFHYASGRLLGTVLGSMASLLSVQIADGRRWVLYIFIICISFIGAYVQAAPGFYALGNAIVCSTISVCTQYTNQNAAMVRIQQNCFAILMYFAVVTILWPMRARTKVKMSLNFSLRCARESITRMLRNLDMPYDPSEVTADVSALLLEMNKKVRTQVRFIPGAIEEPTMGSVEYPEDAWKRIVEAERKLWLALSMMRFAYHTFMSSRADSTMELSVHWVVLHRISPHARDLSDLIYAAIDLYLLSLSNTTVVPTSHLTRLRVGMVEAHKAIEDTYIRTITRKVAGEDSDDEDEEGEEDSGSFRSSYAEDDDYYDPSYGGHGEGSPGSSGHPPPTTNNRTFSSGAGLDKSNINNNGGSGGGGGDGGAGGGEGKNDTNGASTSVLKKSTNDDRDKHEANTAGQKKEETRRKKATHRRADSDSSDSSSDASSSDKSAHNDEEHHKKKGKKKKKGYLGYELTKDEEAALRAFVSNRVGNNTFGTNKSMLGNTTFMSRNTGVSMTAAAAAAAVSGGGAKGSMAGSPPQVNNDARLMAVRGGDDGLAAELRKKHNIAVKKDKDDDHADKDGNDGDNDDNNKTFGGKSKAGEEPHVEHLESLNLSNKSFIKNHPVLKNASFLGSLFNKKPKEAHDLDAEEMQGDDVSSTTAASKKGKKSKKDGGRKPRRNSSAMARKGKREKNGGDETSSGHSTPSTSFTRSHRGIRSDRHSATSDFSDIEDDPRPNRKSGARTKSVGAAAAGATGKEGKAGGRLSMAFSMPAVLSPKRHTGSDAATSPLGEGGANVDGKHVRMASSTPVVSGAGRAAGVLGGVAEPGNALPGKVMGGPPTLPPNAAHTGSFGTVATVGAHSAEDANSPFGVTPLEGKEGRGSPQQEPPPAAADDAAQHPAGNSGGSTPEEEERKAGRKMDSRDSSNLTGSTEKKILVGGDGEGGTTHSSSDEKDAHRSGDTPDGLEKAPASPHKEKKSVKTDTKKERKSSAGAQDADEASSRQVAATYGSQSMNSMRYPPPQSTSHAGGDGKPDHSADRTAELLQSVQDGEPDPMSHFDESEVLNNISFFDPEKGEFVLTNHDIHSLEAFLFGTQALVTYINELQKAILEMQHETELAKRL